MNEAVVDAIPVEQEPPGEAPVEAVEAPSESSPEKTEVPLEEKDSVQQRMNDLTRKWRTTERDRDHWQQEAMRLKQQSEAPQPAAPEPEKTLEDFEYDTAKYADYMRGVAKTEAVEAARQEVRMSEQRQEAVRVESSFRRNEEKYSKDIADYYDVTQSPQVAISPAMAEMIRVADDGPAIYYYLGKNLDVSAQIARLSPQQAAMEIARISTRLEKEPPKVTSAPAPAPRIAAADPQSRQKSPSDMTDSEFDAWRRKAIAKR